MPGTRNRRLTLSPGLALSFRGKKLLPLSRSHLLIFDLLPAQALDLLEELGYFVRHGGFWVHDLAASTGASQSRTMAWHSGEKEVRRKTGKDSAMSRSRFLSAGVVAVGLLQL